MAFLIAGFLGMGAQARYERVIYVTNASGLSASAVNDALPAIQAAIEKDFRPVWGTSAQLIYIGRGKAPKGSWHIDLVDTPPCLSCAGYHDFDPKTGDVEAIVGTALQGMNWQVTFTHELWEMLADPWVQGDGTDARTARVGQDRYIVEAADPVEAERYAYSRTGASGLPVMISDFVTPAWFRRSSKSSWDFTHSCRRPLQILPGGYQLIFRGGKLVSVTA